MCVCGNFGARARMSISDCVCAGKCYALKPLNNVQTMML